MLEGTYRCRGAVFGVHAHVVPTTDPDAKTDVIARLLAHPGTDLGELA
jgi:hypothetical protein